MKVFLRDLAREHERVRPRERAVEVAGGHRETKHVERARVGPDDRFVELALGVLAVGEKISLVAIQARHGRELRVVALEPDREIGRRDAGRAPEQRPGRNLVDALAVRKPALVVELVVDVEADQRRGREADRKPRDADRGVELGARDVA